MKGPYSLSNVDVYVTRISPGAYILSRDGRVANYVGRSDTDVASRINSSAKERTEYTHFWFEYSTTPMQAYYLECEWYHKYSPIANINHPAAPPETHWRCPVSGCPLS